jgi:hypothetical protein
MRRMISVVAWVALCGVLTVGAASAQDKFELAEANAQVNSQWEQILAKCGESYLYKGDKHMTLHEYRDVSLEVTPRPVTEADKLNGIRWAGMFTLTAKAVRKQSRFSSQWEKWKDGGSLEFKVQNVRGKWIYFRRQFVFRWLPVSLEKPSCDLAKN